MIFSKMLTGYYNCENKASIVAFNIPRDIIIQLFPNRIFNFPCYVNFGIIFIICICTLLYSHCFPSLAINHRLLAERICLCGKETDKLPQKLKSYCTINHPGNLWDIISYCTGQNVCYPRGTVFQLLIRYMQINGGVIT